jgi:hypothetical protein
MYDVELKVISGLLKEGDFLDISLPNGNKGYGYFQYGQVGEVKVGQSSVFSVKTLNTDMKVGHIFTSRALAPLPSSTKQVFEFKTGTSFIGSNPNEYFVPVTNLKGRLQVGEVLDIIDLKGKKCSGKVLAIEAGEGFKPDLLAEAMPRGYLTIQTDGCIINTDYRITSVGMTKTTASNPATASSTTFKGERKVLAVNAILENDEIKITVHNIVKYVPKPDPNPLVEIFKIDYSLDYYILDATVENKSNQTLDVGDYALRLNFFTPDGQSADEFGRILKNKDNKKDDVSQMSDVIDKEIFGGSSALKYAGVVVKYEQDLPNYDKKNYDAVWGKIQPKQAVRCESVKAIGVPKSYQPKGIGTWKDNRKKLMFAPLKI